MDTDALTAETKRVALEAGADLVGVAPIDRFDRAPDQVHPRGIFGPTRSVIALACRMVRGSLKSIEEGKYWQAYNCDSYQYLNEVLAPHMLRRVVLFLEDLGYTSIPVHNPFHPHTARPVRPGASRPDGMLSLRVIGCAAGLGELGLSKLLLTPQFGPRQRVFGVLTDAELAPDPLFTGGVCDQCGLCVEACPADAIGSEATVEVPVGEAVFCHGELATGACAEVHQGWDPCYSPFLTEGADRENPPSYYRFLDRRFRHRSICGARACVRACMDHLEKTGRIERQYRTPMIEGEQWSLEPPSG